MHIANELAKLRAGFTAVHGGKAAAYDPKVFLSVAEREEIAASEEAVIEIRDNVFEFADFTNKITPQAIESGDDFDLD